MEWAIGSVIVWLLMLVLTVVWIVLPFAVIGINKRLDRVNRSLDEISRHLGKKAKQEGRNPGINRDF